MQKPYIGITGFMTRGEIAAALGVFPPESRRMLMVGVLGSQKTLLRGQKNKWPNRYPAKEEINSISLQHPLALNLIHYNTKELETLGAQLLEVARIGGSAFDGFQLNVAWPPRIALEEFRSAYPHKTIVLQIGHRAFEEVKNSPEKLATKVAEEYAGFVQYALLDPSGGFGKSFVTKRARGYLRALREKDLNIGLGVAGGLSPETLEVLVGPLVEEFPDLSIDAEGRLRTPQPEDKLDLDRAKQYVAAASRLFDDYTYHN